MFEFSITEIILGLWAAVATSYACEYRKKAKEVTMLMHALIENVDMYTRLREQWVNFKKKL